MELSPTHIDFGIFCPCIQERAAQTFLSVLRSTLITVATALASWLKSRGLILNATKRQVLTISPQQHVQEVTVKSGDCLLPSASSARHLGVHLDNRLDWDTHVNYVVTKVAKKIGALWRARRSLSRRSRQVYVKEVIMPDLLYGSL